jgi:hypothetical protein
MSIQFSSAEVIARNEIAIAVCNATITRLQGIKGLPVSLNADRLAAMNRAGLERTQLRAITDNLRAGLTRVQPLSDQQAAELNALGNKLDQQIRTSAIINASIDFITSVLNDVGRLRTIVSSNQA